MFAKIKSWIKATVQNLDVPVRAPYFRFGVSTKTSAFTYAPATDGQYVGVDATAGAVACTLPAATSYAGLRVTIEKVDAGANDVTVATVEGGTVTLDAQYDSVDVISNGTVWRNAGSST